LRRLSFVLSSWVAFFWYWIRWPFMMVWRVVVWFGGLLKRWWELRNLRYFLQGLPALPAMLAVSVTAVYAYFRSGDGLYERYKLEAYRAMMAQNYRKAILCWERLYSIDPRPPEVRFGLAQAAMAEGRLEYAFHLIDQLAPADAQGYCLAHLERGRRLLLTAPNSPEAMRLAEVHLKRALTPNAPYPLDDARAREARAYLGELYIRQRRYDDAFTHLTLAAAQRPELNLLLAELYTMRGLRDKVRDHARLAVEHFRRLAEEDINNVDARIAWANGLRFLEQFEDAVKVLVDGYNVQPSPRYRVMISLTYLAWSENEAAKPTGSEINRLAYLERSLFYDPGNLRALQNVALIIRGGASNADKARSLVKRLLTDNPDSAFLQFSAGTIAYEEGRLADARMHWELAYKLSKEMPLVANNLAWLLATEPPIDRNRAMQIIDSAIESSPDQPILHGTRGFILAQMGRYREAIFDLVKSTPVNRERDYFHETLAECYEQIGNKSQAEEHRQVARLLKERMRQAIQRTGGG
jgi:tetratricopeptide (TPR) repeat protein